MSKITDKLFLRSKYFFVFLILCVISVASFCLVKASPVSNTKKDDFVIVTSFYPMYIATLNLADDIEGVEVKNLTNNVTGCLHDYQLSTKDLKLLDSADVLIVNGGGMENFIDDVIAQFPNLNIVTATQAVELLSEKEVDAEHNHDEEEELEAHSEQELHKEHDDHEHSEEEHAHDHGEFNAHSWMDIDLYTSEVEWITDCIVEQDPKHKSEYEKNLEQYKNELKKLKEEAHNINLHIITAGNNSKKNGVILFHEAFEYLEELCNFTVVDVIDMDENTNLSAGKIGDIVDAVNEGRVKYIITDEMYGKKAAETLEKECGVKVLYIEPLTSGEDTKDAYIKGMKKNLEVLKEAFL